MKKIWVISMFPEMFHGFRQYGVIASTLNGERGEHHPTLEVLRISDFCDKGFKGIDAAPYGGGAGMVMRADVLEKCLLEGVYSHYKDPQEELHVIATGPRGQTFKQATAEELSQLKKDLVIVCGRYEGIDERFLQKYVHRHLSLGDFVLSGGELACMSFLDATIRLIDDALGNGESIVEESFQDGLLEYPHYTRPQTCCDRDVPEALLSGDHKKIAQWRQEKKMEMTKTYRPELLRREES